MKTLQNVLHDIGVKDVESKLRVFENYMNGILEWHKKVNLTAITDRSEFIRKHFVDSLICADSEEFTHSIHIADVGTGGGFPGVPLAICFPEKEFVLMDSLAKRVKIVEQLCSRLGIINVKVVHGRAEELGRRIEYRECFDLCVSRAVANMSTLSEYCLPFVKIGGYLIAYKGVDCKSEIDNAKGAIEVLGGGSVRIELAGLNGSTGDGSRWEHSLVYIKKISQTPKQFPRKAGTPAKRPL